MTLNERWSEYKGYKVHYGKSEVQEKQFYWCDVWHPEKKWNHVYRQIGMKLNDCKKKCQEYIDNNPL